MVSAGTAPILDAVATRLTALGRGDPDLIPPGVAVQCLLAADHLRVAGARLDAVLGFAGDNPHAELRAVMTDLAGVPADVFAGPDILDAAAALRVALARLEDLVTTSIGDLLACARDLLAAPATTADDAHEAISVLRHTGRALGHLAADHLGDQRRQSCVTVLADACRASGDAWERAEGRLVALAGAASDLIASQSPSMDPSQRWAVAAALAETSRRAVQTARAYAPYADVPQLRAVHDAAAALEQAATADPPSQVGRTVLDHLVPTTWATSAPSPARAVADAAAGLAATLHAESARRGLTVAEALSVIAVSESTARSSLALAVAVRGARPGTGLPPAAEAWRAVRNWCRPFDDGTKANPPRPSPVIAWSDRLDRALHVCFGEPTRSGAAETLRRRPDLPEAATALRLAVNQLPDHARHLDHVIDRWIVTRQLLAPERNLPSYENRYLFAQSAGNRIVTPSRGDLKVLVSAVRDAGVLSAALAAELNGSARHIGAQPQPNLAAAHERAVADAAPHLDRATVRAPLRAGATAIPTWSLPPQQGPRRSR